MTSLTRRQFVGTMAAGTLVTAKATPSAAEIGSAGKPSGRRFPDGFVWGCATSAYQIEGAANEGGRAPSIWDTFSHQPNTTHNGDNGDVANDSYHLYKTDVQLLKKLGVKAYRFSMSWSRIFPSGSGRPNEAGISYYQRLIDELIANGIVPYTTLFHWDLPQAIPDGWRSRDTAHRFADYAAFIAKRFSDRVHHFMTTNEFLCFTDLGYQTGQFAPGLRLEAAQVNQVRHNAILAHGLGVLAIRANAGAATQVGFAENAHVCVPVIETEPHIRAAMAATREENAPFLTAVLEGRYTDAYLAREGANAPKVLSGDMKTIASAVDFVGHNVYAPTYVSADESAAGYQIVGKSASFPRMASPWLFVGPEASYWAVRNVCELWKPRAMYITENGCSADDVPNSQGKVMDIERVMFLRNHLTQLQRASSEGYPLAGYFLWSLMDNFEWDDGYQKRFGIHYVDFKTQRRTPKLSADWYSEVVARNTVV